MDGALRHLAQVVENERSALQQRVQQREAELTHKQQEVQDLLNDARRQQREASVRLADARRQIEQERATAETLSEDRIVDLDVGGTHMRTYRSTLVGAGGMLEVMFSGRHKTPRTAEGHVFIDCDPALFRRLLTALRLGGPVQPSDDDLRLLMDYLGVEL